MSTRVQIPMRQAVAPARSFTPKPAGMLRRSATSRGPETAPSIVHEVLRSPGQPLDSVTRAYFEPRFGHDFSMVRVHADAKAAESAQAVNALAYTVGHNIVFANRPSFPGMAEDTRILAHELTHVLQQSGGSESPAALRMGSIDCPAEREANQAANAVLSNQSSAPPVHAVTSALQREPGKTPTQTPAQTPADPRWGSKNWPGEENDWNAFYQQAIQGLAGGKLKPEKIAHLAATVADSSMLLCHHHGKQMRRAMNATDDEQSKSMLNLVLVYGLGSRGLWGDTFRSAIQSTTSNVDGPRTAEEAVQRAGDIADQAARGMLGEALWKTYMDSKATDEPSSPKPLPKTGASKGH